jgi:hypothetical protein
MAIATRALRALVSIAWQQVELFSIYSLDSYFLIVLKIKCTKFHQDRSKTVDLHTKYENRH